uniref:Pre-mRNA-splicing factor SYF1 n=1 Tax=Mucochytrium quahogii TaxID=96639 RepID=A0A7S2S6V0_9STRA|mmetsp:Transcript_39091/g.63158  ORF Transcript_39091/g.63158 Transcript_39091/m.63158 type:complete len:811 (+) Transcript_39091:191-2623(+)|eukprot:CAMPEP_0203751772 /NCGR_PEP_ID=MMETSP0098-20131031/5785_1 /ASSEMBLY_ACC=CAM_ASM_000208 /TAXON_ID=96639 /ORGANISM=" , Strain NY0313808BC1" /LENGTH=810 /DNA_ID=CAMNT_0050641647 /DNA_START=104 /DNA_END=2536 /DNA_ORIENTATION=-
MEGSYDNAVVEEAIVRDPYNVNAWVDYLHAKKDCGFELRKAVFERALYHVPGSYKLWFKYLVERVQNANGRGLEESEYAETNRTFERSLVYMHKMPRIWLEYISFLDSQDLVTETRHAFDGALRALPVTQHGRIWKSFIGFVDKHKSVWQLGCHVYPRYIQFDASQRERYVNYLIDAKKYGLAMQELCSIVKDPNFVSVEGKTVHNLWMELCSLITKHPEEARLMGKNKVDVENIIRVGLSRFGDETGRLWCALASYYISLGIFDKSQDVYEEALRTVCTVRDFSTVFDAYTQFHEAMLSAKIDIFGDDEEEKDDPVFYTPNVNAEDKINDVDIRLVQMEKLLEDRPLLLNSVVLRQNPHNCIEWENRAKLFLDRGDLASVVNTYKTAIDTVNPANAVGEPSKLWVSLAKVYEDNADLDEARSVLEKAIESPFKEADDLVNIYCASAETELRDEKYDRALAIVQEALRPVSERELLEKMSLQQQMKNKGYETNLEEDKLTHIAQLKANLRKRVFKSTKLWTLYVDLEESLGTVKTASIAYDRMIELKVATPQTILNYAAMLEENNFFEDAFQAYEKGVALFSWPHVSDIWINYVSKFIERYKGEKLLRTRDIFEQALKDIPNDECKPLFLLLGNFEEQYGDPRKAMNAYDRLCKRIPEDQKKQMFLLYVGKAEEYFGIARAREIYELAIETLQDPTNLREMCLRYAEKERKLGEIDRARGVLRFGSQFADPRTVLSFWKTWNDFEVAHGNEDTFREMLRVKRTVSVQYKATNYALEETSGGVKPLVAAVGGKRVGESSLESPIETKKAKI